MMAVQRAHTPPAVLLQSDASRCETSLTIRGGGAQPRQRLGVGFAARRQESARIFDCVCKESRMSSHKGCNSSLTKKKNKKKEQKLKRKKEGKKDA